MSTLGAYDRDLVIRTILGEASNQGDEGWAAVAHVIRNRTLSPRFPNSAGEVATQGANKKYAQFSTWNKKGDGGNSLHAKYRPGDKRYDAVGKTVDAVFGGEKADNTGGATHYYAPSGMLNRREPRWWQDEVKRAGGVRSIGGHRFAGSPNGTDRGAGAITRNDMSHGAQQHFSADQEREMERIEEGEPEPERGVDFIGQEVPDHLRAEAGTAPASFADIMVNEWSPVQAYRASIGYFEMDPQWSLTQDHIDRARQEGLEESYIDRVTTAHSEGEYEARLGSAKRYQAQMKELHAAGGMGTVAQLVGAVTDPVALAVSVGTFGVAAPLIYGAKAGRLANTVRVAAVAGIAEGAAEAAVQSIDANGFNLDQVFMASAAAMTLGGTIGALSTKAGLSGEALKLENAGRALARQIDNGSANSATLIARGGGAAGAARAPTIKPLSADDLDVYQDDVGKAFWSAARFSSAGRLGGSENAFVRAIYDSLGLDAAGRTSGVTATAATERQSMAMRVWTLERNKVMDPAFRRFHEANKARYGTGPGSTKRATKEFQEEVSEYIRNDRSRHLDTVSPEVKQVGDWWRSRVQEIGLDAQNPMREFGGVGRSLQGFKNFTPNPNYVPRIINQRALTQLVEEFGDDQLHDFFSMAFKSGRSELPEGLADRVGKGYLNRLRHVAAGIDEGEGAKLFSGDIEDLKEVIDEIEISDIDKEAVMDAVRKAEAKAEKGSGTSRGKRRALFDEGFKANARGRVSGLDRELRFDDFLVNDFHVLSDSYFRNMSGWLAMAKVVVENPSQPGKLLINGITNDADIAKLIKHVRQTGSSLSKKERERDVDLIMGLIDSVLNRKESGGPWLKRLRDFNYIRVMNQAGAPSAAEVTNIAAVTGTRAMLEQMPAFRRIIDEAGVSRRADPFAEEAEQLWGFGADRLMGQSDFRFDHFGDDVGIAGLGAQSKSLDSLDELLEKGRKLTSDIGGLRPVTQITQQWAARAISHRLALMAVGEAKHLDMPLIRSLGMADDDLQRVLKEMKKRVTLEPGKFGKYKLTQLNTDSWNLQEAAVFKEAVYRFTRKAIQETDPGMLNNWLSAPLGRIIFQFRSFMLGSYDAQLLSNMNAFQQGAHKRSMAYFSASLLSGSLMHAVRVGANAAGMAPEHQRKYLDRMLEPKKIAGAAFSRVAWSTFLPDIGDTAAFMLGQDTLFGFAKSANEANSFVANPSTDLAAKSLKAVRGLSQSILEDRPMAKSELRNFTGITPLQNALPFVWAYSWAFKDREATPPIRKR